MDPLERLHEQLNVITSKLTRMEYTIESVLMEQKKTNGRVTAGEEWRRVFDLKEAGRDGESRARAESFVSKKQIAGLLSALGVITGIAATIGTVIARSVS